MQEYTGIDSTRLEQMETRLKGDVLAEAALHGGRLLVAREVAEPGHSAASLVDVFEAITGLSCPWHCCHWQAACSCKEAAQAPGWRLVEHWQAG